MRLTMRLMVLAVLGSAAFGCGKDSGEDDEFQTNAIATEESEALPELKKVTVGDDVELHYVELGKGVPLVLIHGGLSDYTQWNDHLDAFAASYRTIAYSCRYSYPNKNQLLPNHTAVVDAEDLAALIKELDLGKVHIVGYSYGAYTGLILAIEHPELVRTLTLAEPPVMCWLNDMGEQGKSLLADGERKCWTPARIALQRNDPDGALRMFVDYLFGDGTFDNLPPAIRDRAFRNRQSFEALAMSNDRYPPVDRECVRGLRVPTLLLYGANTHLAAQLVGAELKRLVPEKLKVWVSVPEATHGLWNQKPEECRDAVLRFLAGK